MHEIKHIPSSRVDTSFSLINLLRETASGNSCRWGLRASSTVAGKGSFLSLGLPCPDGGYGTLPAAVKMVRERRCLIVAFSLVHKTLLSGRNCIKLLKRELAKGREGLLDTWVTVKSTLLWAVTLFS